MFFGVGRLVFLEWAFASGVLRTLEQEGIVEESLAMGEEAFEFLGSLAGLGFRLVNDDLEFSENDDVG